MKLIIDIDKYIAQGIINGKGEKPHNIVSSFQATIADAIKNGTPLEEELEKIKDEINDFDLVSTNGNNAENVFILTRDLSVSVIEKHIKELHLYK